MNLYHTDRAGGDGPLFGSFGSAVAAVLEPVTSTSTVTACRLHRICTQWQTNTHTIHGTAYSLPPEHYKLNAYLANMSLAGAVTAVICDVVRHIFVTGICMYLRDRSTGTELYYNFIPAR